MFICSMKPLRGPGWMAGFVQGWSTASRDRSAVSCSVAMSGERATGCW